MSYPKHIDQLIENVSEVDRLLDIHANVSGTAPGRRREVEVLNKSALVLLVACWESYVEDLAENCFNFMVEHSDSPYVFEDHVLAIVAKEVKKRDTHSFWEIHGDGWKNAIISNKDEILDKYVVEGSFNTPRKENIDKLYSELIGFKSISSTWYWPGQSRTKSVGKLEDMIKLRGEIAHRVRSSKKIHKLRVTNYKDFIYRLSIIMNNRCSDFIKNKTGKKPWKKYSYR
ncbi:HEPN domain-containing protein [Acidithiobacillus sp.]|uniref:HEPN domain-containing protein n=1 Tax=Acidithiobacillus sp. TaxID=1872118 RepID=UPI003CFC094F